MKGNSNRAKLEQSRRDGSRSNRATAMRKFRRVIIYFPIIVGLITEKPNSAHKRELPRRADVGIILFYQIGRRVF